VTFVIIYESYSVFDVAIFRFLFVGLILILFCAWFVFFADLSVLPRQFSCLRHGLPPVFCYRFLFHSFPPGDFLTTRTVFNDLILVACVQLLRAVLVLTWILAGKSRPPWVA
jgi:hypothetical protein